jgi:hypothetical protein
MNETNSDALWDQVTADAGAFSELTTETGTELSDLIRAVNTVEVDILTREEELKKLKKTREKYIFDLIPSKMNQIGMSKVEVDGNTVSLSTFVNASMPKDPNEKLKALTHLRDNGFSDFIKNEVHVVFGIHEDSRAQALQTDLDAKGHQTTSRVWVEPQTLKKVIREDMENGHKLNGEIFNTYIGTVAKIKGTR